MIKKISWLNSERLDSSRDYSLIHLTSDEKTTICELHSFADHFKSGDWIPYRVGKRRQGICENCRRRLSTEEFKEGVKHWSIPENDTTKWQHHYHGAIRVK